MQVNQGKLGKVTGLGLTIESQDLEDDVNTAPPREASCLCAGHVSFSRPLSSNMQKTNTDPDLFPSVRRRNGEYLHLVHLKQVLFTLNLQLQT